MTFKWKHLNRNRSRLRPVHCVLITMHACGFSQGGTQPWEISCQCADHQRWLLLLRQQKALSGFVLRGHLALSPNLGQASANRKGYLYRNLGFSKLFRALCFVRSGGPSTPPIPAHHNQLPASLPRASAPRTGPPHRRCTVPLDQRQPSVAAHNCAVPEGRRENSHGWSPAQPVDRHPKCDPRPVGTL